MLEYEVPGFVLPPFKLIFVACVLIVSMLCTFSFRLEHTGVGIKEMTGFAENNDTWSYKKDSKSRFTTDNHVRCVTALVCIAFICSRSLVLLYTLVNLACICSRSLVLLYTLFNLACTCSRSLVLLYTLFNAL